MKLIEQSYEICKTHGYTLQDIYKDIERAARVSYKSEDKITEDSAEKMVKRLINMKHYSPLEFGTVYLKFPNTSFGEVDVEKYEIVATLDGRTSETCRHLDGKVFDIDDYKPGRSEEPHV